MEVMRLYSWDQINTSGYVPTTFTAPFYTANSNNVGVTYTGQVSITAAPIPEDYEGQIVELGAGNGAITLRLAARCPRARVLACEINPTLARDNRAHLAQAGLHGRVVVVPDSAEHLLSEMRRRGNGPPAYIISGIPLGNLGRARTLAVLDAVSRSLAPGGIYIQYQHSLLDRKKIKARFLDLRIVPVPLNFPPAVVYYARK